MDTFRELLDSLCRSRGVLYAELARRVGVTKSYVGQLVHGQTKPPPMARCRQLAEALELGERETERLLDLAVRERARAEARQKIEELDALVGELRAGAVAFAAAVLASRKVPAQGMAEASFGEVLAEAEGPLAEWLAGLPPARLAGLLARLADALSSDAGAPRVAGPAPGDHGEAELSDPGQA